MKRGKLTKNELEILETALIEYGSVITFDQLCRLFDKNREYNRKRISKLTQQGWLKRIKKGVFVLADLSSRGTLSISYNAVVNAMVEEAYISFEAALQHHGMYDQLLTNINAVSLQRFKSITIDGITYKFIKTQQRYFYGWETHNIDGQSVKIASVEKALIDLIQFHRNRYFTDLVLEKLFAFQISISQQRLSDIGLKANLTTRRILGFLMDFAGMDSNRLLTSIAKRKSVSAISNSENNIYNHKWSLFYDHYFEKYFNTPAA